MTKNLPSLNPRFGDTNDLEHEAAHIESVIDAAGEESPPWEDLLRSAQRSLYGITPLTPQERTTSLLKTFKNVAGNPIGVANAFGGEVLGRTFDSANEAGIDIKGDPSGIEQAFGANSPFIDSFVNTKSEAKQENFDPRGLWAYRGRYNPRVANLGVTKPGVATSALRTLNSPQSFLNEKVQEFKQNAASFFNPRSYVPGFLSDSLLLKNPVVEEGGTIKEGASLDPDVMEFLKNKSKTLTTTAGMTRYPIITGEENNMFTTKGGVYLSANPSNQYDIGFEGGQGMMTASEARKLGVETKVNPLTGESIKYQLGNAISSVPVGGTITAEPIGGEGSKRARMYERMSKGALKTNANQEISTTKLGATSYLPSQNNFDPNTGERLADNPPVQWNPEELKDPLIKRGFGFDPRSDVDVSSLRGNPTDVFVNRGPIDFTKPVITTENPVYKFRQGLKSGLSVGAADFIPAPEAVRSFYAGRPLEGVMNMAGNFVSGLPLSLATGAAVTAAPALAPVAAGAGLGMTAVAAGRALNEVSRQQTGEGLLSKFRQFAGTRPRTGVASPQPTGPRPLTATVRPLTPAQRAETERQRNRNEAQRRIELAGQRWNPARGEFGLSELFFGR